MRQAVQAIFAATLQKCIAQGALPAVDVEVQVDAPKQAAHGDWATNLAMVLQKRVGKPPRQIAELLVQNLVDPDKTIVKCDIAGPGFINVTLAPDLWYRALHPVLQEPASFGRSQVGQGEKVLVEFVSANPTGPMHVGHGRGAVVGDVLCNLLSNAGYQVSREYYINDAGGQIKVLGRSVHVRYQQAFGRTVELGEKMYPGEYVKDFALALKQQHGDRYLDAPEEQWLGLFTDFAIEKVLAMIRADLDAFGIRFDRWFSERRELHERGAVEQALAALTEKGLLYRGTLPPPKGKEIEDYEPREQLLFKSTDFGDDQDRGLQKSDGSYTYFAGDIAYHQNKLTRAHTLINIWGADHAGAVTRIKSAVQALAGRDALQIVLIQLVNLFRNGEPVRMGKRSGNFVALRDILEEVGTDATRFYFVMRSASTTLDFDLALAKKQSTDNPVFYVQYGHARIASILRKAAAEGLPPVSYDREALALCTKPEELELIKRVLDWPEVVAGAAKAREPHRVVFYLQELIASFHSYYTKGRIENFRILGSEPVNRGRLQLVSALQTVLRNGLAVLGISAPEQMSAPQGEEE
jgi:arginyl-tRNA synthetase